MSADVIARPAVPEFKLHHRMSLALEQLGWSVQDVASFLAVERNTVSRWINGHRKPARVVLMVWADMTGVPLEWLETGQAPVDRPGPDASCAARDSNPEPAS